jgi:hypothetical protein
MFESRSYCSWRIPFSKKYPGCFKKNPCSLQKKPKKSKNQKTEETTVIHIRSNISKILFYDDVILLDLDSLFKNNQRVSCLKSVYNACFIVYFKSYIFYLFMFFLKKNWILKKIYLFPLHHAGILLVRKWAG